MQSYHDQLQAQALNDLSNRGKSGIIMYIVVWLIISLTYGLQDSHPTFFQLNTALFVLLAVLRVAHLALVQKNLVNRTAFYSLWFNFNILVCSLHWGLLVAWIFYDDSLSAVQSTFMIITPAFALGGACTLSISSEIRVLYPTLMFAPLIAVFIFEADTQHYLLAGLSTFALFYIFASSRSSHKDYWEAITNYMVAEERAELMERLSITDQLTQIHNRLHFDSEFSLEWRRSTRLHSTLSVLMIDIDHFKSINDQYGHVFGDECLKAIAHTISIQAKRPNDCVARYGGEEFVVLLPNTNDSGAQIIAQRMINAVEQIQLQAGEKNISLTISIGGASVRPTTKEDKSALIKRADSALYEAKRSGRNRYRAELTGET